METLHKSGEKRKPSYQTIVMEPATHLPSLSRKLDYSHKNCTNCLVLVIEHRDAMRLSLCRQHRPGLRTVSTAWTLHLESVHSVLLQSRISTDSTVQDIYSYLFFQATGTCTTCLRPPTNSCKQHVERFSLYFIWALPQTIQLSLSPGPSPPPGSPCRCPPG